MRVCEGVSVHGSVNAWILSILLMKETSLFVKWLTKSQNVVLQIVYSVTRICSVVM